jgi:predicted component of type VI protein secretion system
MSTQIKDSQQVTDAHSDRSPPPVDDVPGTTAAQPSGAVNPTIQQLQDLMIQLMRQGVDISLRSLQVWADLARPHGCTALGSATTSTHDLFEKLLAAQREVVDELVATHRQFARGFFDTTATTGNSLVPR